MCSHCVSNAGRRGDSDTNTSYSDFQVPFVASWLSLLLMKNDNSRRRTWTSHRDRSLPHLSSLLCSDELLGTQKAASSVELTCSSLTSPPLKHMFTRGEEQPAEQTVAKLHRKDDKSQTIQVDTGLWVIKSWLCVTSKCPTWVPEELRAEHLPGEPRPQSHPQHNHASCDSYFPLQLICLPNLCLTSGYTKIGGHLLSRLNDRGVVQESGHWK